MQTATNEKLHPIRRAMTNLVRECRRLSNFGLAVDPGDVSRDKLNRALQYVDTAIADLLTTRNLSHVPDLESFTQLEGWIKSLLASQKTWIPNEVHAEAFEDALGRLGGPVEDIVEEKPSPKRIRELLKTHPSGATALKLYDQQQATAEQVAIAAQPETLGSFNNPINVSTELIPETPTPIPKESPGSVTPASPVAEPILSELREVDAAIVDLLRKTGHHLKRNQIFEGLKAGVEYGESTIRNALANLADDGTLTSGKGQGRGSKGYGLPDWDHAKMV